MTYVARTVDIELDDLLDLAPAIALDGPKGVGKTATASRRATASWQLDDPAQRSLLEADPEFRDAPAGTLLLDEWQRLPETWDSVRRRVDEGAPPGRFLLTGSASPGPGVDTHSGAGRILSLRMRPLALHERELATPTVSLQALLAGTAGMIDGSTSLTAGDYLRAIERSGFPGIHGQPDRLRRGLLDAYLQRVIDRDLPDLGFAVRRPETLRRWLAAYAAATSTTTSYSRILDATTSGDGSQPAKTTTITYRDQLSRLWLLDPVPGWSPSRNPIARLQQAPKHQLADPALAARLLNLSAPALASASGAAMAGPLFESLAALGVRVAAQAAEARVGHLRTRNGDHEVDLVVEGPDGQVLGIEVKLAASVHDGDVRHLLWLRDQLPDQVVDLLVLTTGRQAYRRRDGVVVVPLALLGA
ncbi:ATP-binding protein [Aeromicrobium sp. CF4.19]|uniref:ATP-binding protein n=1 Tax=Aeromicrobium sp. CF4.19 TaxID=3373082 RepID=UPI003EE80252